MARETGIKVIIIITQSREITPGIKITTPNAHPHFPSSLQGHGESWTLGLACHVHFSKSPQLRRVQQMDQATSGLCQADENLQTAMKGLFGMREH